MRGSPARAVGERARLGAAVLVAFAMLSIAGCRTENADTEIEAHVPGSQEEFVAADGSVSASEPARPGTLRVESPTAADETIAPPLSTGTSTTATTANPTTEQPAQTTATTEAPLSTTTTPAVPPTTAATSSLPSDTHPDIVRVLSVKGRDPGGDGWKDSYSVGQKCYCATTFDHDIGDIQVDTPTGTKTVREVCEKIGDGPGPQGRPIYNDIQCGNGPANNAGDEDDCPGRVDIGRQGCGHIGPKWDLTIFQ